MVMEEVSPIEYDRIIGEDKPIYYQSRFLELNSHKVEKVHYLVGIEGKIRAAFAIGEKDRHWDAPFSAPFGGPVFMDSVDSIRYAWDFFGCFDEFLKKNNAESASVFLPPDLYSMSQNAMIENALLGNQYALEFQDINFHIEIAGNSSPEQEGRRSKSAIRNTNNRSGRSFVRCDSPETIHDAYEIIRKNRENKRYPLKMSESQVLDTFEIVGHDAFIASVDDVPVASAILYYVTKDIAQVIYWGDIDKEGKSKIMNYLAAQLVGYCKSKDIKILDIGPASGEGKPSFGLCSFKSSIGCLETAKRKYRKSF